MPASQRALSAEELNDTFSFFTEIGIISQLSRALFEAELPNGFQVIHFSVLNNLARSEEKKLPSDLARAFQVPRSNMSDILERLEKHGFVRFIANPKDKRSKIVLITASGRKFRQKAIRSFGKPTRDLAKHFDLRELKAILPTLSVLREVMDTARSSD